MRKLARHLGAWLAWWLALFWLWMLLVGEWNRIEWVAAACAAALGATIAEYARTVAGIAFRIPRERVAAAASVPVMIVVDFAIVMGVVFRSLVRGRVVRGRFVVRELDTGGDDPRGVGSRAWTTLAATYSPNAYVVDIDPERDTVLLHDLVVHRRSEEPA